jgi:hypothetical protein
MTAKQAHQHDRIRDKDEAVRQADEAVLDQPIHGQAINEKNNDERQCHSGEDVQNRMREQADRKSPDAGDVNQETRSDTAPFNKSYGGQQQQEQSHQ